MGRTELALTLLGLLLALGCSDGSATGGAAGAAGITGTSGAAAALGGAAPTDPASSGAGGVLMEIAGDSSGAGVGGRAGDSSASNATAGAYAGGAHTGGVATGGTGSGAPPEIRAGCEAVEHDGHDYALCRDAKVAFPEARKDCVSMNMQLIRLDSADESDWIYATFYAKPAAPGGDGSQMWVGGTDTGVEGEWRWLIGGDVFWHGKADGMTAFGLYANWGRAHGLGPQDQPNDAHSAEGEDCMVIRGPSENEGGKWTDISCADENRPPAPDTRLAWYTCESL